MDEGLYGTAWLAWSTAGGFGTDLIRHPLSTPSFSGILYRCKVRLAFVRSSEAHLITTRAHLELTLSCHAPNGIFMDLSICSKNSRLIEARPRQPERFPDSSS
jgi:hypothetical protein